MQNDKKKTSSSFRNVSRVKYDVLTWPWIWTETEHCTAFSQSWRGVPCFRLPDVNICGFGPFFNPYAFLLILPPTGKKKRYNYDDLSWFYLELKGFKKKKIQAGVPALPHAHESLAYVFFYYFDLVLIWWKTTLVGLCFFFILSTNILCSSCGREKKGYEKENHGKMIAKDMRDKEKGQKRKWNKFEDRDY